MKHAVGSVIAGRADILSPATGLVVFEALVLDEVLELRDPVLDAPSPLKFVV